MIHCPKLHPSERLIRTVEIVGEAPQVVYKIPLKNAPEEGLVGIELPEILDRVIIGPTDHYPLATYEAFVTLLDEAGVPDPGSKVRISAIPLRR